VGRISWVGKYEEEVIEVLVYDIGLAIEMPDKI
jgi:hypothetical protein